MICFPLWRSCSHRSDSFRPGETLENQAILRGNVGVIAGGTDLAVKQFGFGDHEQSTAKTRTRRQRLLAEMEAVVPWQALVDLIAPYYPKPNRKAGRPPYPIET